MCHGVYPVICRNFATKLPKWHLLNKRTSVEASQGFAEIC